MVIVRTYADEGKSGFDIANRAALKQLIRHVVSGEAYFSTILVLRREPLGASSRTPTKAPITQVDLQAGRRPRRRSR